MRRQASFLLIITLVMSLSAACASRQDLSTQLVTTTTPTALSIIPTITFTPTQTRIPTPACTATLTLTKAFTPAPTPTPTKTVHLTSTPIIRQQDGDWIVTGSENVSDVTINLNGNLVIEPSGSLTLTNVTLLVQQKPQGMYQILAKPGSRFAIFSSTIAPSQSDARLGFIVQGAQFVLKQSKLEGLGRPSGYNPRGGLLIYHTNGTIIEGNTINHHEVDGILLTGSTNTLITNNTIVATGPEETTGAVQLDNSHNNTITHNRLIRQWDAIHLQSSWNNYIAYNELTLSSHTIGISVWHGSGNNIIAYNHISAHEGYDDA